MTTYLLAGGGTAGHVNPLLAVADGLRARDVDANILVLGTNEGLESHLVPERGYELLTVAKVPFPRRPNADAIRFPARWRRAIADVRGYIRERGVDVVLGVGGYAAAPAYIAAKREGIPAVVHEANARPGLANVLGARTAAAVGAAFPGTPLRRAEVVGMPLRPEIEDLDREAARAEAAAAFDLSPDLPTLLVFGGSLGAKRINETLVQVADDILRLGWQVLHVTGKASPVSDPGRPGYRMVPYITRMDLAYALATVVLARSGASTVSEVSALALPAVYVPYAVGNGEQRLNAAAAVGAGAAIVIDDQRFSPEIVRGEVLPLLADPARIAAMRTRAESTAVRSGTRAVIGLLDRVTPPDARRKMGDR